jgi:hypothetical protein
MEYGDVVTMRLRVGAEVECDGYVMQQVWLGVLAEINKRSPSPERNALIRSFAEHIADATFCKACWRPIEHALQQVMVIGHRIQ